MAEGQRALVTTDGTFRSGLSLVRFHLRVRPRTETSKHGHTRVIRIIARR